MVVKGLVPRGKRPRRVVTDTVRVSLAKGAVDYAVHHYKPGASKQSKEIYVHMRNGEVLRVEMTLAAFDKQYG